MRKFLIAALAFCFAGVANSQFTYDYLKAADDYYRKADYYSAAQYYEKYLGTNGKIKGNEYDPYVVKSGGSKAMKKVSTREQAIYNLAESYRHLNFYVKAEPHYQEAASFSPEAFPLADYYYATTLRALGKFSEAEAAFTDFLATYKQADKFSDAAQREVKNLQFIQAQMNKKDLDQYKVTATENLASEGANYAPVWASPNTMYFTTTRPDATSPTKEHINKLYEVSYAGGTVGTPAKVNISQPAEVHQGGAVVTADGNTMYLTRWMVGEGEKTAGIYWSTRSAAGWSDPVAVSGLVETGVANYKQPALLPNGKLLFSSDRSGGEGGFDLWMADINSNGAATNLQNLGSTLNTAFDEEAPVFHQASKTLVFATNGRVGMGGFDLFSTIEKEGNWSEPVNLGYPINSIKNDMYFASTGPARNMLENVFISTDRNAECCMQMFNISKALQPKLIAGTVVDCETKDVLPNASVQVVSSSQTVFTGSTTTSGAYSFTMEEFKPLEISASLQGYSPNSVTASLPADEMASGQTAPVLCLNKIPDVGVVEVIDNIYFAFDKATVLEESYDALNKLAQMLKANPNVEIELRGHTDSKGSHAYNMGLSKARAKNVAKFLIEQGIEESRLTWEGFGETMPVAPNTEEDGTDNPEGRAKNRRTEFKVIKK